LQPVCDCADHKYPIEENQSAQGTAQSAVFIATVRAPLAGVII